MLKGGAQSESNLREGKRAISIRGSALRELEPDEVLVRVNACGFCGSEIRIAKEASDYTAIGHEVAGTVASVGNGVTHVKAGDRVVLESGSYDRFSDLSRDGKMDLDNTGRHFWHKNIQRKAWALPNMSSRQKKFAWHIKI